MNNFKKHLEDKITKKEKNLNNIYSTLEEESINKMKINKKIAFTVGVVMFVAVGSVTAASVINSFKTDDSGIKIAEKKGFYQENDGYKKYNDLGINISKILVSNSSIVLNMDYLLDKNINKSEIDDVTFKNFKILVDNKEIKAESMNITIPKYDKKEDKLSNTIIIESLSNNINAKNELYISFNSVSLLGTSKKAENIKGNWKYQIKLNDILKKNASIKYIVENNSNKQVKVINASMDEVNLKLKLVVKKPYKYKNQETADIKVVSSGKTYSPKTISQIKETGNNVTLEAILPISKYNNYKDLKLIVNEDNVINLVKDEN